VGFCPLLDRFPFTGTGMMSKHFDIVRGTIVESLHS
jgi:hypothetical protein